jgi:tripartite-type tricarboxylate transporter receptor subunit TctC
MAESGYPTVELSPWFGLVAPAGTPDVVIRRLHDEFVKAAMHPELVRKLSEDAIELNTGAPGDFAALIASEKQRLGQVIRALGIQ